MARPLDCEIPAQQGIPHLTVPWKDFNLSQSYCQLQLTHMGRYLWETLGTTLILKRRLVTGLNVLCDLLTFSCYKQCISKEFTIVFPMVILLKSRNDYQPMFFFQVKAHTHHAHRFVKSETTSLKSHYTYKKWVLTNSMLNSFTMLWRCST